MANVTPVSIHHKPKFDKNLIKVGANVKVSVHNERMWAEILKIEGNKVYAELRNDHTLYAEYQYGKKITFLKSQILDLE